MCFLPPTFGAYCHREFFADGRASANPTRPRSTATAKSGTSSRSRSSDRYGSGRPRYPHCRLCISATRLHVGALPTIRLSEEPKHGKVTVRSGKVRTTNLQKCLAAEVPAFVVIYRSSPDFEGQDEVALDVATGEKRQIQRITITVTNAKGMQRI